MRIALDFAGCGDIRSGVRRYGLGLAKAMVQSRHCESVRIPCFDRLSAASVQELEETGAEVVARGAHARLDNLEALARGRGRLVPWNRFLPFFLNNGLRSTMLRRGLGNTEIYHSLFLLRAQVRGVRMVSTIHDLIPLIVPEHCTMDVGRFRESLERCRRDCDVIIVPSHATKDDLVKHAAFDSSKIRVVYHGIDHDYFHPDSDGDDHVFRRHDLKAGKYLFYVGAIDRRKNLSVLLDAYLLARASKQVSIPLVLAGPIVGDMSSLTGRLQSAECRDCVKFLGYCSDAELPALYRGARAFCFISLYEGFGFPPLEAMACGTPTIASENSSLGEIVGEAAVKVNPRNVEQIAEAIGLLTKDGDAWSWYRSAGIAHAGGFTWENAATATCRAYLSQSDETPRFAATPYEDRLTRNVATADEQ